MRSSGRPGFVATRNATRTPGPIDDRIPARDCLAGGVLLDSAQPSTPPIQVRWLASRRCYRHRRDAFDTYLLTALWFAASAASVELFLHSKESLDVDVIPEPHSYAIAKTGFGRTNLTRTNPTLQCDASDPYGLGGFACGE